MLIVFPRAFVTSTTFTSSVFLSSHDFKKIRKRVFFGLLSKGSSKDTYKQDVCKIQGMIWLVTS